jgi:hypothetical protein
MIKVYIYPNSLKTNSLKTSLKTNLIKLKNKMLRHVAQKFTPKYVPIRSLVQNTNGNGK